LADKALSQIKFEIEQIDRLFALYGDLLKQARKEPPDLVEVTALAED
jgi:hypothetical protein